MIDHLQVRCTYETFLPITINDVMRSYWFRFQAGLKYAVSRKGLMAGTSSTAHAITRSQPGLSRPDVMVRIYHLSGADRYSRSAQRGIDAYPGFTIGGFKLHPKSRGSIHLRTTDPLEQPSIQPNYLSHNEDRAAAIAVLRLARRIASQPSLSEYIVDEHRPGPRVLDDAGLLDYACQTGQTSWHAVGTCRMGPRSGPAVVDERLRVHGVQGLRVIDASVMRSIASTNTNAPAIMIGEKGADMVLEEAWA
jgi:choline dehydrogenase